MRAHTSPLWDCHVEAHACVHSEAADRAHVHTRSLVGLHACSADLDDGVVDVCRSDTAGKLAANLAPSGSLAPNFVSTYVDVAYKNLEGKWSNSALADVVKVPRQFAMKRVENERGELVFCVATVGICAHSIRAPGLR